MELRKWIKGQGISLDMDGPVSKNEEGDGLERNNVKLVSVDGSIQMTRSRYKQMSPTSEEVLWTKLCSPKFIY